MFNFEQACAIADEQDLIMANMIEPRPEMENEPFHFSQEFKDTALRHVWTRNQAAIAAEVRERGIPYWI